MIKDIITTYNKKQLNLLESNCVSRFVTKLSLDALIFRKVDTYTENVKNLVYFL